MTELGATFTAEGNSASVGFDREGRLLLSYVRPGEGIFLERRDPFNPEILQDRVLLVPGAARHPQIKSDPEAGTWILWEDSVPGGRGVFLGRLEGVKLGEILHVSRDFPGENDSAALGFDSAGEPWIVWIQRERGFRRLLYLNVAAQVSGQVNTSLHIPLYTPRILIDGLNTPWIFWVQDWNGHTEVKGRRFAAGRWLEASPPPAPSAFPSLTPDVCPDGQGRPLVVWSTYDGEDYELSMTTWSGQDWTPTTWVTKNRGVMDVSPSLIRLPDNSLALVWNRTGKASQILCRFFSDGAWGPEYQVGTGIGYNRDPILAVLQNRLALGWENISTESQDQRVNVRCFHRDDLLEEIVSPSLPCQETLRIPGPPESNRRLSQWLRPFSQVSFLLDWLRIIGFGDSITYGVVARTWFPDKGYVPRLEILLKSLDDLFAVLNRGLPGELTLEGLARIKDVILEGRAKFLLLMEGTNDITGRIPSSTAAFNIGEMVKICLQHGVYPLPATIIPRSDAQWNSVREETIQLNTLIRDICGLYALPSTDMFSLFMDHPEGYLSLFSDGAHPNEQGYQIIASHWFETLRLLPIPPVDLSVERAVNQILFFDEPVNILRWENNPLLAPEAGLVRYIISRKREGQGDESYMVLTAVSPDTHEFLDRTIQKAIRYSYRIQAENAEGVIGPASLSVSD